MSALRAPLPEYDAPSGQPGRGGMPFLEHLEELRTRLIRSALAVAAGMAIAFVFIQQLVDFVLEPARRALPTGTTLVFTQASEGMSLYIDVALFAGTLLAAPVIFYQVWRFIAPGLYANERRFVVPFVLLTSVGALAGAAFGHYVFFPSMLTFFGTFSSPDLLFLPRVSDVFGLYLKMLGGLALVFQMPTFAFFLSRMNLITARWLWHHLRYAILIIFVAAAILTPSADPWNQIVFAVPMLGLYFVSIVITWLVAPRRALPKNVTRLAPRS
jgi:sec-independent protein translocase protein TatC